MKRLLKKLLQKALGPRRSHSLQALIRASAIQNQRPRVCVPEAGKIVVLAPHMDDEVLGCGGTMARHVQAGADLSVVFLTDGRRGGSPDIRKQEARRACEVLGVREIAFIDAEDGRLRSDARAPDRLRAILERESPDILYLPFFLENHVDHCAAGELLLAAAGPGRHFECRSYEVWTPLFPNRVVEIDSVLELKKRALACYSSQLALMDYAHTGLALNAFRSSAIGCKTARFVEAYFALPLSDYRRLHRLVSPYL